MFKGFLRALGEGTANVLQGIVQDATLGKKARRGRNGAFKPQRTPRVAKSRSTRYTRPHATVVYVYGGTVHL